MQRNRGWRGEKSLWSLNLLPVRTKRFSQMRRLMVIAVRRNHPKNSKRRQKSCRKQPQTMHTPHNRWRNTNNCWKSTGNKVYNRSSSSWCWIISPGQAIRPSWLRSVLMGGYLDRSHFVLIAEAEGPNSTRRLRLTSVRDLWMMISSGIATRLSQLGISSARSGLIEASLIFYPSKLWFIIMVR